MRAAAVLSLLSVAFRFKWAAGDGTCSATRLNGTSFHGSLRCLKNITSAADCCATCATTETCAIWTLSSSGCCYLRANGVKPFANPSAQSGYTSAAKPIRFAFKVHERCVRHA